MGKCVVIVGGMASGKTTLAKELERQGFKRIITYTTRPKRGGERDRIDYNFISEEEFNKKIDEGFFAESVAYNACFGHCLYGSAKKDYNTKDDTVIVLNPRGVINLTEPAFIVYLDLRESLLRERAITRGDSLSEINRRIEDDRLYFAEMKSIRTPNLTFKVSNQVEYMAEHIIDLLKSYSSQK
jgi:guanylate kinase